MEFILAIIFGAILMTAWYAVIDYFQQKSNKKYVQRELEYRKSVEDKRKRSKKALDSIYGKCTKALCLDEDNNYAVRIYKNSQTVVVNSTPYKFTEITGCECTSKSKEDIPMSYVTTTNKGDMAVRTVVGAALGGSLGALAGAVTAKKTTKINQAEENRRYEQKMYDCYHRTGGVNMYVRKSTSKPVIFIPCFKAEEGEICAAINAIIAETKPNQ